MADDKTQGFGSAEGAGINQSDIDALFSGGGDGDTTPDPSPSDELSPGEASAVPADSPTGDGGGEELGGTSVSQADLDTLFGASGRSSSGTDAPNAALGGPGPGRTHDADGGAFADATAPATAQPALAATPPPAQTESLTLSELVTASGLSIDTKKVTMLSDVKLRVKLQLGKTQMLVEDVLNLGEGSVVELDKLAGDPIDVLVNDRLIARGEVLVLNDNFCVRISEVLTNDPHRITT